MKGEERVKSNNLVEWVFRNESQVRQAVWERRNDAGGTSGGGCGKSCSTGDPVANRAIRNASELPNVVVCYGAGRVFNLRRPERWLKMVEIVQEHYKGGVQGEILEQLYKQGMSNDEVMENVGVRRTIFFVMKSDILAFAEGVACGLGVL